MNSDEIEEVSHEMLDHIIEKNSHVAVMIYKSKDKHSEKVLKELGTKEFQIFALKLNFKNLCIEKIF